MDAVAERVSELMAGWEISELTDLKHADKQSAWLTERGIPHKLERRRVILSRAHVRGWLEGRHVVLSSGINFAAIR